MDPNILYILITIILIVFVYKNTHDKFEKSESLHTDEVIVKLNDDLIYVNKQKIIQHLRKLKDKLLKISKVNYTPGESDQIRIDSVSVSCLTELHEFIDINSYGIESNVATKEKNHLFGKSEDCRNNILRSDISDAQRERYEILYIVTNIDIILDILQNSVRSPNEGYLQLTNLHTLVKLYDHVVYGVSCSSYADKYNSGVNYITSGQKYLIDDLNEYCSEYTYDYGVNHRKAAVPRLNKMDQSQDVTAGFGTHKYDGESYVGDDESRYYEQMQRISKPNMISNETYNTQYISDSGLTYIIKRDIIKPYIPFCDLSKIRSEKKNQNKYIVDYNTKHALRNDYNF